MTADMSAQNDTLSVPEAAKLLSLSEPTIRRYCRNGTLAANMVPADGKQDYWAIEREACEQFSQARRASGAAVASSEHDPTTMMSAISVSEHFAVIVRSVLADQQKALAAPPEEIQARIEAEQARDQLLREMNERLAEQPQLHDLISQVGSLQRELQEREREKAHLQEELAAERRTTWWQRLLHGRGQPAS